MAAGQLGKFFKKMDQKLKTKFRNCKLLVLDFDGVMTDNMVFIDSKGNEFVRCNKSDGLILGLLRKHTSVLPVILSSEKNKTVAARGKKLHLEVFQGEDDKKAVLEKIMISKKINPENVCYVGNDLNDLNCFSLVGLSVAVSDSCGQLKKMAKYTTKASGGYGAVREVCELILNAQGKHPWP